MCQVSWHEGHYVCCDGVSERSACSSSQSLHFQAHVWSCWLQRFTLPHRGSLAQSWQCLEACLLLFATRLLLSSVKGAASKASKVSLTRFSSVDSAFSQISALTLTNSTWSCKDVMCSSPNMETKLILWEKQLRKGDYVHFPHLAQCDTALVDSEECTSVLSTLRNEFSSRFTDVRSNLQELKLVSTPFDFPYDDAPTDVQMELVELQASDVLSSKFSSCTHSHWLLPSIATLSVSIIVSPCQARDRNVWQHLFVRAALFEDEIL